MMLPTTFVMIDFKIMQAVLIKIGTIVGIPLYKVCPVGTVIYRVKLDVVGDEVLQHMCHSIAFLYQKKLPE